MCGKGAQAHVHAMGSLEVPVGQLQVCGAQEELGAHERIQCDVKIK